MMNVWQHQRGMTAIGWLLVLGLIGFFALLALKLVPIYIGGYKVISSVESLKSEHNLGAKSVTEIRTMLMRRLDINMVTDVRRDDIVIRKEGSRVVVDVAYEVREPLFGNLDVVVNFDRTVEVATR